MKEKKTNAKSVFEALCQLEDSGNNTPDKHPENCECVDCASKKWDGNEEEILDRAVIPDTQKDIYERSRKSDQEVIDHFNEVNEVKEKKESFNEKKLATILQKALIYFTAFLNFPICISMIIKLFFTQDYISTGLHIVSLLVVNYVNDKIH